MEPVVNETAELDSNVPKVLCQLDNHLGKNLFLYIMNLFICIYDVYKYYVRVFIFCL
jgi:hypothetical protein